MNESRNLDTVIRTEVDNLKKELDSVEPLLAKLRIEDPDPIELRAVATTLHAFYGGIERIFLQVAKHIDENMPAGASWHRALLNQMVAPIDARNAVIDEAFRDRLSEYLGFRHFYRHAYPMSLKWDRIQPLVNTLQQTHQELEVAMVRFIESLNDRASGAPLDP